MAALDLRPLSLGELLDRTFFLYRRNFPLFVGIAVIPYSLFFVMNLASALMPIYVRSAGPRDFSSPGFLTAAVGGGLFALLAVFAGFVAFLFSVGATVYAVSELYMGRRISIRESFGRVRGKTWTIFGVLFLSGLILLGGFLALVIPGIYLMCRVCVATPAALLEDLGASDSIRRSFELTRDFAGRAFMIYLVSFSMAWALAAVFQMPFALLITLNGRHSPLFVLWTVLMQVGNFLASALVAPVSTIGFALFYYDLRVRKEAFDLQMMMQALGADPMPPPVTGSVPSMFGRDAS
jgi:hypothetical protein